MRLVITGLVRMIDVFALKLIRPDAPLRLINPQPQKPKQKTAILLEHYVSGLPRVTPYKASSHYSTVLLG